MQHSLIVIIWSLFVSFHDFHVTHTTIYYNADKEALEITVNIAIEDLERQRLTLVPNNHLIHYQWVGKEVSQDLHNLYIYFEVLDCNQNGKIESLLIENSIFIDILPDQSNIVLVEFGDKSHNLTFSRAHKRHDLTGLN